MAKLVFLHGRAQEDKDPLLLRQRWIAALQQGLRTADVALPIDERDIVFPYYGDALRDATSDEALALAMVRYPLRDHADEFGCAVLWECLERAGITKESVTAMEESPDNGSLSDRISTSLSYEWIQRGLSLLDRHIPGASARSMASTAADVTQYLQDPDVQDHIENGVARAFAKCESEDTVVVGHSLGSIVAYRMLRADTRISCRIRSLITIGSPLGINVVRQKLEPLVHPPRVDRWLNAFDERDVIALNPLDGMHFPIVPSIRNYSGVENNSSNHHQIGGYLSDPIVATWIANALLNAS